jgi:hypothetical protein
VDSVTQARAAARPLHGPHGLDRSLARTSAPRYVLTGEASQVRPTSTGGARIAACLGAARNCQP